MADPFSYLLVLNAAEGTVQIVLAREEACGEGTADPSCGAPRQTSGLVRVHASEWHALSQGAELLIPVLADICGRLSITPRAIRRIACVNGPGSFTGLRLVLSTAAGLSRSSGALSAGMPYLPLLAEGAAHAVAPGPEEGRSPSPVLWVLTHARRNLVHAQGFTASAGDNGRDRPDTAAPGVAPVTELLVLSLDEAAARMRADARPPLLLGSGISRNKDFWRGAVSSLAPGARLLPAFLDRPYPDVLLRAASTLSYTPKDVEPLYVRPCDAEENLERIARSLGLEPEQARKALHHFTSSPASAVRE